MFISQIEIILLRIFMILSLINTEKLNILEGTFYIQLRWASLSRHRLYVQSAVLLSLNSFENVRPFKMNKNVQHNLAG